MAEFIARFGATIAPTVLVAVFAGMWGSAFALDVAKDALQAEAVFHLAAFTWGGILLAICGLRRRTRSGTARKIVPLEPGKPAYYYQMVINQEAHEVRAGQTEDMVMMSNALTNAGILGAEEIAMLTQVYEDLSTNPQYIDNKAARDELAKRILHEFQSGVTDVYALKQACGARQS